MPSNHFKPSKPPVLTTPVKPAKRVVFVTLSALILAFNINTFVAAGGLIPGGFTGLALLIREIGQRFFDANLPLGILFIV
jgi:uncharacterized membrane-anchored protein YitT (DUF2179 family)